MTFRKKLRTLFLAVFILGNYGIFTELRAEGKSSSTSGFPLTSWQKVDLMINVLAPDGALQCPVQLLLVDSLGRKTGFNPSAKEPEDDAINQFHEIPNSFYEPEGGVPESIGDADWPIDGPFPSTAPIGTSPIIRYIKALPMETGGTYTLNILGQQKGIYHVDAILTDSRSHQTMLNQSFIGFSYPETKDVFSITYNPYVVPYATFVKEVNFDAVAKDLKTSYELGLIAEKSLYNSLLKKSKTLARSKGKKKENVFRQFLLALDFNRAKIAGKAYDILKEDTEYLAGKVIEPQRKPLPNNAK